MRLARLELYTRHISPFPNPFFKLALHFLQPQRGSRANLPASGAMFGKCRMGRNANQVLSSPLVALLRCISRARQRRQLYRSVTEIPIGGEGGWEHLEVDSAAHRVYLSHATKVVVVDLEKNAVVGEIADTPGVHALVASSPCRSWGAASRPTGRRTKSAWSISRH